jgi:hypothetical protein
VLDQANYRIVVIDPVRRTVIESLPTGRAPFSIALAPDEKRLYVTNAGLFRYSLIEGYDAKNPKATGFSFPPFGFPSREAEAGVTAEGKVVPGLGDPNHPDAASVWSYGIGADGRLTGWSRTKTGRSDWRDGRRTEGGRSVEPEWRRRRKATRLRQQRQQRQRDGDRVRQSDRLVANDRPEHPQRSDRAAAARWPWTDGCPDRHPFTPARPDPIRSGAESG